MDKPLWDEEKFKAFIEKMKLKPITIINDERLALEFNPDRIEWLNRRTGQWEAVDLDNLTDERAVDYIAQIPAAQGLYRLYRRELSPLDAVAKVLEAQVAAYDANHSE